MSDTSRPGSLADKLPSALFPRLSGLGMVAALIAMLLIGLLIIPVLLVIYVAFLDPNTGALTLNNFQDFFGSSLFRESFWNSFYVSAMSVVFATVIALPLAYITTRFNFAGSVVIQSLKFACTRTGSMDRAMVASLCIVAGARWALSSTTHRP